MHRGCWSLSPTPRNVSPRGRAGSVSDTVTSASTTSIVMSGTRSMLVSSLPMRPPLCPTGRLAFTVRYKGWGGSAGASISRRSGLGAVKRKFAPEFVNRIDTVITYQPLDAEALEIILDQQIAALERHIANRLEERAFTLELDASARKFLLARGTSSEYGARELKRIILRKLTQPLAAMVEGNQIAPESVVQVGYEGDGEFLTMRAE